MPTSNPVEVLLTHGDWATRQILEACGKLTHEQFHRRFEMGPGSLHDTVTHILGATRRWADLLAAQEERPRLEGTQRGVEELSALHDEIWRDFAATARAHPLEELITASRGGRTMTMARGAILTHVATHAMHHRAQCLNMLRHVGVNPLPLSSVLEWIMTVDAQRAD